jgi:hypothetical protein
MAPSLRRERDGGAEGPQILGVRDTRERFLLLPIGDAHVALPLGHPGLGHGTPGLSLCPAMGVPLPLEGSTSSTSFVRPGENALRGVGRTSRSMVQTERILR